MKSDSLSLENSPNPWAKLWLLDPSFTFLNHGAFGAVPLPILDAQQRYRTQLEHQPLRFFMREFEPLLDESRRQLAAFIGADLDELVFIPNATTGVNTVLRSLSFQAGDELLTTNLEYNACRNALDFIAHRTGATVIVAELPFPIESADQVIEAVLAKVSPRTRLALLDHVTSPTALILPIQELVSQLTKQGIETLIDGAHAPGMIPLNLREIGATYYTGNCHKWLCAPKGAAFLAVQRDKQSDIHPLTISHGANSPRIDKSRFQLELDWMGTNDPSAYFCVGDVIQFLGSLLPGGWLELMKKNHLQALAARELLCEQLGVFPPCPDTMVGSMAVVPLPDELFKDEQGENLRGWPILQDILFNQFKIEVPIINWGTPFKQIMRISAQLYNHQEQYKYLATALLQLIDLSKNEGRSNS